MKITHRAPADASAPLATEESLAPLPTPSFDKAPRLSCCCRLSELLPMVRQLHDTMRAAQQAKEGAPGVAA